MHKENNDSDLSAPVMKGTEKPSHIQLGDNLNDTLMGMFKIRDIVKRKSYSCYELNHKKKKRYSTGVIPYFIFVVRDKFMFCKIPYLVKIVPFRKPVLKPWAIQPLSPFLRQ